MRKHMVEARHPCLALPQVTSANYHRPCQEFRDHSTCGNGVESWMFFEKASQILLRSFGQTGTGELRISSAIAFPLGR